jgi:thiamine-monophosphate kinase
MKVSELGEFGLIERLAGGLASQWSGEAGARLLVGIGDDAAVWRSGDEAIIATTDTLVADVHFTTDSVRWSDVGWKAIAVNVSDIAAMGGSPEVALVTVGLTPDAQVETIDDLYAGMNQACEAFGVAIAGGDVVTSPVFFASVAMTGRAQIDADGEPQVLRRNAAEAGDLVAVTGTLGGSAAGLRVLQDDRRESEVARALIERHLRPMPRLEIGRAAVESGIRCAIDVSDGLVQDLGHVCKASRVGAVVWSDKVPFEAGIVDLFGEDDALQLAASGGEDYELLLTGNREQIDRLVDEGDVRTTVIGEIVIVPEHQAKLLDEVGHEIELASTGWDHLSSERP